MQPLILVLSGALAPALISIVILLIRAFRARAAAMSAAITASTAAITASTAAIEAHSKELASFAVVMKGVSGFSAGSLRLAEAQIATTTKLEESLAGLREDIQTLTGSGSRPAKNPPRRGLPAMPDFTGYDPERAQHAHDIAELVRSGMTTAEAEDKVGDPGFYSELEGIRAAL